MPFQLGPTEKAAIQQLKDEFIKEPVIASFYKDRQSIVETDASDTAVGAVHLQKDELGKLYPVAYFSKKHSPAE